MKRTFAISCLALCPLMPATLAADDALHCRTTLELSDGSRLVGTQTSRSLPVDLDFAKVAIPIDKIRQCTLDHQEGRVTLDLLNGDRLTGRLDLKSFPLETSIGTLSPALEKIDRMTFTSWHNTDMPPGEGDLFFGGVQWLQWHNPFEVQGDKLVSLPKARPGFNYGHNGNGRGATLVTNIGNTDWKDYRIEVEFCVPGVDPAFNPYGLGADYHDGRIMFHAADARESFNAPGTSSYYFNVSGDGTWSLGCIYNYYCDQPVGWGNPKNDGERTLASGSGLKIDRVHGNKYRIDVLGKTMQVWVDGKKIVESTDDQMDAPIGNQRLDHGGVGFIGGYDAMIWIRNFSARSLPEKN